MEAMPHVRATSIGLVGGSFVGTVTALIGGGTTITLIVAGSVGTVGLVGTEIVDRARHRRPVTVPGGQADIPAAPSARAVTLKPVEAEPPPPPPPPPPAEPGAEGRVFTDATPEYLVGFFRDHTAIQAQKLADPFLGRWTEVSGPLGEVGVWIGGSSGFSQVTFKSALLHASLKGGPPATVFMIFRDASRVGDLAVLKRGDQITVRGRIDRVDFLSVQLEDCELV